MKVYVAIYDSRKGGTSVDAYATREAAVAARQGVARQSWQEIFTPDDGDFDESDPDVSTQRYFGRVAELDGEFMQIEECDLVGSSSPIQMFDALEVFAARADTPGADRVPDDGTVTVFMKDCREARAARVAEEESHDEIDIAIAEHHIEELEGGGFFPVKMGAL